MLNKKYDKIIIGGGIYGLYAGIYSGKKGENVLILEKESESFKRATYINQARVHMGYHYPRSYSTAIKSANYFNRFVNEFSDCILSDFNQIYATSSEFSWTNAEQFRKFCTEANILCDEVSTSKYFNDGMCDGAFLTKEYTYDAMILRDKLIEEIAHLKNVEIRYGVEITLIKKEKDEYIVYDENESYSTGFLLNCTYASVNQILDMLGFEKFKIKYELCEIILCSVSDKLKHTGLTVMDGPFFSLMPFGKTGYHSLTSVTFTPHTVSYDELPAFKCQSNMTNCSPKRLGNCNDCFNKPRSAWEYMSHLAKKYMKDDLDFQYIKSLYSMKPILMASEIDDSRPTVIKQFSEKPYFYSILSGKINTVYDMEEIL